MNSTKYDMSEIDSPKVAEYSEEKKKLLKKLPSDVREDLDAMDEAALRKRIVQSEGYLLEIASAKKADEQLASAKEVVKSYAAPYSDSKRAQAAIIAYSTIRLNELGKL